MHNVIATVLRYDPLWRHGSGIWKIYHMGDIHRTWRQTCDKYIYFYLVQSNIYSKSCSGDLKTRTNFQLKALSPLNVTSSGLIRFNVNLVMTCMTQANRVYKKSNLFSHSNCVIHSKLNYCSLVCPNFHWQFIVWKTIYKGFYQHMN